MRECFLDTELTYILSRGTFSTWKNHCPKDPNLHKLDRAIANEAWLSTFPNYVAFFDSSADSDHAPYIISLDS